MDGIFSNFGAAFLARDLHRLRQEITAQSDLAILGAGIEIPSSCTSLVLGLLEKAQSVSELSSTLGYSHQLTTQRVNMLLKLGLVKREQCRRDARRKLVALTPAGRRQAAALNTLIPLIDAAMRELFSEIGHDLGLSCREALTRLQDDPILKRIPETHLEDLE